MTLIAVRKPRGVMGLDLSFRASAAIVLPLGWGGDFRKAWRAVIGKSISKEPQEVTRLDRLIEISDGIVEHARATEVTHAVIEKSGWGGASMAGLHDVVAVDLRRAGISVSFLAAITARKLLLGAAPRRPPTGNKNWVKDFVRASAYEMGVPEDWSADEVDAWVLLNALLADLGGTALVSPPPTKVRKGSGPGSV